MISLTQEERDKFASWLEQDAISNEEIAEQTKKLFSKEHPLVNKYRSEALAARIVAKGLRSTETTNI